MDLYINIPFLPNNRGETSNLVNNIGKALADSATEIVKRELANSIDLANYFTNSISLDVRRTLVDSLSVQFTPSPPSLVCQFQIDFEKWYTDAKISPDIIKAIDEVCTKALSLWTSSVQAREALIGVLNDNRSIAPS